MTNSVIMFKCLARASLMSKKRTHTIHHNEPVVPNQAAKMRTPKCVNNVYGRTVPIGRMTHVRMLTGVCVCACVGKCVRTCLLLALSHIVRVCLRRGVSQVRYVQRTGNLTVSNRYAYRREGEMCVKVQDNRRSRLYEGFRQCEMEHIG